MNNINKVLKGIIQQVNNSIKKTPQTLTPEEQDQVKKNLGISDTVASTIPDWDQNDETAADYVKNRTHFRTMLPSDEVLLSFTELPEGAVEEYEEDGVTKYRWTHEKYPASVKGSISREKPDKGGYYDRRPVYAGDQLSYAKFISTHDPEYYDVDLVCDAFRLQKVSQFSEEGYPQGSSWIFTPYKTPEFFNYPSGEFRVQVFNVIYSYNQLGLEYIPTTNDVNYGDFRHVPTASAVEKALRTQINWNNLQDLPFYHQTERTNLKFELGTLREDTTTTHSGSLNHECLYGRSPSRCTYEVQSKYLDSGEIWWIGNGKLCPHLSNDSSVEDTGGSWVIYYSDWYDPENTVNIIATNVNTVDGTEFYIYEKIPEVLQKLDEKFLPDSTVTLSDDDLTKLENLLNPTNTEE